MFPPANANIITNELGEPLGWDVPSDEDAYYHDECGSYHNWLARCPQDEYDEEDYDEYDPGPEVDDEGGMSEVRNCPAEQGIPHYGYDMEDNA